MKNQHSGSGTLRGGGVRRVYGNRPTFKEYKRKMDYRLGFVTIFSLATIMIILFIYALFHTKGHDALTEYVNDTRHFIELEQSLELTTLIIATSEEKTDEKREIPLEEVDVPPEAEEEASPADDEEDEKHDDEKDKEGLVKEVKEEEPALLLVPTSTSKVVIAEVEEQEPTTTLVAIVEPVAMSPTTEEESTSTSTETTTTTTTSTTTTTTPTTTTTTEILIIPPDPQKLTIDELDGYYNKLHSTYITLWNLAGLNLIVLIFLVPLTYLFYTGYFKTSMYKLVYRVSLFLALLFLLVQLIYLIDPLLTSAWTFPSTIDRLFLEAHPREKEYLAKIESRYACSFEAHEVLILRGIEDPCVPKIKDSVLPTYTVILLIIIDLLPFVFAFFTYAWDAWIKDSNFVRRARLRIEENNAKRPQTREQILNRTLAQEQEYESNRHSEAHNLA